MSSLNIPDSPELRIVFITGGLGVGRDGVGDYVRRLAGELLMRGYSVGAIGINDGGVVAICEESHDIESMALSVLRLPRSLTQCERSVQAVRWMAKFQPDWISLQFVCFGLHSKGLVSGWAFFLNDLCSAYRVHWMFHELWVGLEGGHPWRYKPWGWLQKYEMLRLYRDVKPRVTHTSNERYARVLGRVGVTAEILPLFGNIPVVIESEWKTRLQFDAGIPIEARGAWLVLGVFGTIQRQWLAKDWFAGVLKSARSDGRKVILLGIGRRAGPSAQQWERLENQYAGSASFHHFGEQPAARISQYLQFLDYGVATGPASVAGKSGTIAAMLEHRKEVLVPYWDLPIGVDSPIPGVVVKQRFGLPSLAVDANGNELSVERIAHRLVVALETSTREAT